MQMVTIKEVGKSPREVRLRADLETEQTMNLSALSTLLISENIVQDTDIYKYLDIYFRDVSNPITARLALVKGELEPYFNLNKDTQSSTGEFYSRLIESLEENSIVMPYNLQTSSTRLFDEAQDLVLPYFSLDEEKRPKLDGIALFTGRKFNGETLKPEQGVHLNLLNNSLGKYARLSYMFEKVPLSILINKSSRKIHVQKDSIEINLKMGVELIEYAMENLQEQETRGNIEKFLKMKIEEDLKEVIKKLQDSKCDAIGLGRIVRAYHTQFYNKDWGEKFSTLDISVNVEVEVLKSGILS